MGICNKVAGIAAPILLGTLVLHGMDDIAAKVATTDVASAQILGDFAAGIHVPYLMMAAVLARARFRHPVFAAAGRARRAWRSGDV